MQTYSPISVLTGRASGITEPARIGCQGGATKGHRQDQGGLRGHSVGDSYPWRVVGIGDSWAVQDCRGVTQARYWPHPGDNDDATPCRRAHSMARQLKLLHPLGRIEEAPCGGPANISGPVSELVGRLLGHYLKIRHENGRVLRVQVIKDHPDTGVAVCMDQLIGKLVPLDLGRIAHDQRLSVEAYSA